MESDGKRNYERYMAGESWTPQEGTMAGAYEPSPAQEAPHYGYENVEPQEPFGAQGLQGTQEPQGIYEPQGRYESQGMGGGGFERMPQPNNIVDYHGLEEPVSVGEWLIAILLMMVPCVNLILMFVWAFGSSEKKSKSNYFKAMLICMGILIGLYMVLGIVFLSIGVASVF